MSQENDKTVLEAQVSSDARWYELGPDLQAKAVEALVLIDSLSNEALLAHDARLHAQFDESTSVLARNAVYGLRARERWHEQAQHGDTDAFIKLRAGLASITLRMLAGEGRGFATTAEVDDDIRTNTELTKASEVVKTACTHVYTAVVEPPKSKR